MWFTIHFYHCFKTLFFFSPQAEKMLYILEAVWYMQKMEQGDSVLTKYNNAIVTVFTVDLTV